MNTTTAFILATALVVSNGLIGHYFPPNGILLTPFIIIATTSLVCLGTKNTKPVYLSLLTYFFIALNDLLIKHYSGGIHDREGLSWIYLYLLCGLMPAFIILIIAILVGKEAKKRDKLAAMLLFPLVMIIHLKLTSDVGL